MGEVIWVLVDAGTFPWLRVGVVGLLLREWVIREGRANCWVLEGRVGGWILRGEGVARGFGEVVLEDDVVVWWKVSGLGALVVREEVDWGGDVQDSSCISWALGRDGVGWWWSACGWFQFSPVCVRGFLVSSPATLSSSTFDFYWWAPSSVYSCPLLWCSVFLFLVYFLLATVHRMGIPFSAQTLLLLPCKTRLCDLVSHNQSTNPGFVCTLCQPIVPLIYCFFTRSLPNKGLVASTSTFIRR